MNPFKFLRPIPAPAQRAPVTPPPHATEETEVEADARRARRAQKFEELLAAGTSDGWLDARQVAAFIRTAHAFGEIDGDTAMKLMRFIDVASVPVERSRATPTESRVIQFGSPVSGDAVLRAAAKARRPIEPAPPTDPAAKAIIDAANAARAGNAARPHQGEQPQQIELSEAEQRDTAMAIIKMGRIARGERVD